MPHAGFVEIIYSSFHVVSSILPWYVVSSVLWLSFQDSSFASESSQRFCTVDAQFSLLLRISHHYGKHGSQILLSMGALQNLSSCNLMGVQKKVPLVCKRNYMLLVNSYLQFCILSGKFKGNIQYRKGTGWWNWQEEVTYCTRTTNSHLFYITRGIGWFSWG